MPSLNLTSTEKDQVQAFVENLHNAGSAEVNVLAAMFAQGNEAAWYRFVRGAVNHPITWWVGIFQLQMQMGIWGFPHRATASTRASTLWRLSMPLRDEVSESVTGGDIPLLSAIVRYNLKYRRADIAGRFVGGSFTDYASMGGRFGSKRLSWEGKLAGAVTNLGIASYGAAIKAMVGGHKTIEAVIQAVLTGRPENLPHDYRNSGDTPLTGEESRILEGFESAFSEVMSLTRVAPGPVPISEFCSQPENANLKGLCR